MDDKWEFKPGDDFAEVLDKVEHGETVEVTRGGQVIARVVPVEAREGAKSEPPTLDELRALRKGVTLGPDLTIKDLINEGRRF